MTDNQPPQSLQELVERMEADRLRFIKEFVVVTIDNEDGHVVNAVGIFDTVEAAYHHIHEVMIPEDDRIQDPGDHGWTHQVVPLFT